MSEIEECGIVVRFFTKRIEKIMDELQEYQEELKTLNEAIDKVLSPMPFSHIVSIEAVDENSKQNTLASMYMYRERLSMKILEKKSLIKYTEGILSTLGERTGDKSLTI